MIRRPITESAVRLQSESLPPPIPSHRKINVGFLSRQTFPGFLPGLLGQIGNPLVKCLPARTFLRRGNVLITSPVILRQHGSAKIRQEQRSTLQVIERHSEADVAVV